MKDNENGKASEIKNFIEKAFTSEAKAARVPYYLLAICILLFVICVQLNFANKYLKVISCGGEMYKPVTGTSQNDPFDVFYEETSSETTLPESSTDVTADSTLPEQSNAKPQETPPQTSPASDTQGKTVTYVINKNSKKIHYSNCTYASNMKPENKLTVTITPEKLKSDYMSNGYTFCSRCGS